MLSDDLQSALLVTCRDQIGSYREGTGLACRTGLAAQALIKFAARFGQDQRAQQGWMAFSDSHCDMTTPGMAEQRNWLRSQCADESRDVCDVCINAKIPALARPVPRPTVAHR